MANPVLKEEPGVPPVPLETGPSVLTQLGTQNGTRDLTPHY